MHITFHGAAQCVTGSKHLIHLAQGNILLDCGMFQGMGTSTYNLNASFNFEPSTVTALILSHAHIDHCGLIPKLVQQGFVGRIYCIQATMQLTSILLQDSAHIQAQDTKQANKRRALQGLPLYEPLYTEQDVSQAIALFTPQEYNTPFNVMQGVTCTFTDAGHIIGSAAVHVTITENGIIKQITFSGDVGRYTDAILKSPQTYSQADYIIMESTYGNTLHNQATNTEDTLLQWITNTCVTNAGKLIIPAFSVGRTQELLYALNTLELQGRLPALDYIVDSPLSQDATDILKQNTTYFNNTIQAIMAKGDSDPFAFKGLHYTQSSAESKLLNYRQQPCVIISASGMADSGRVKHHISNNIENSRNAILLSGYCEPNSLGGRLKKQPKEVMIYGQLHQVNATIGELRSMSAHGDYNDLLQWLSCQNSSQVKQLFLVHGELGVQQDLKHTLIAHGYTHITIPKLGEEVALME